jgi:hypothetical protein
MEHLSSGFEATASGSIHLVGICIEIFGVGVITQPHLLITSAARCGVSPITATGLFMACAITRRILPRWTCSLFQLVDRRKLTANPAAEWVARQNHRGLSLDEAPHYLIRDRDRV